MGKEVFAQLSFIILPYTFSECLMIVSFASSKGGVGKSTICAAIGARLAGRGEEVLILDLDQNRTVERWGRKAKVKGRGGSTNSDGTISGISA
jgi:cellulose biosynthesis protein BcsQ